MNRNEAAADGLGYCGHCCVGYNSVVNPMSPIKELLRDMGRLWHRYRYPIVVIRDKPLADNRNWQQLFTKALKK
jgi:hypothetical protein